MILLLTNRAAAVPVLRLALDQTQLWRGTGAHRENQGVVLSVGSSPAAAENCNFRKIWKNTEHFFFLLPSFAKKQALMNVQRWRRVCNRVYSESHRGHMWNSTCQILFSGADVVPGRTDNISPFNSFCRFLGSLWACLPAHCYFFYSSPLFSFLVAIWLTMNKVTRSTLPVAAAPAPPGDAGRASPRFFSFFCIFLFSKNSWENKEQNL